MSGEPESSTRSSGADASETLPSVKVESGPVTDRESAAGAARQASGASLPPSPLDAAVGQLSNTTPTGNARVSTTLRTGGGSARTLVGQNLGRYEIVDELGHGGMATVYRARDPRLERNVALKVIHRHLRDNAEIAQRFRHEAQAVAKLKHPSIVEIYDVPDENEDDERFLVAELVEGPSLRKYLSELRKTLGEEHAGLFPPELAGALILQVLGALGRAHQEGIVHRDVKPENILIATPAASPKSGPRTDTPSNPDRLSPTSMRVPVVAKLTDFGIAKILDAQSMTSTGQILGSPAHMAPEQIEAGEISERVDVFATGVLFYELMTGSLPFEGKNPAQVIRRVLDGQFTPADRVAPQVGGRWNAIVAQMLAREPEKRPASTQACENLIRKELEAMGVLDPDRELLEFMRDPKAVADGWGARVKPRLLERAVADRKAGDVVGSAHDLNRALAYDPNDPKLMRAVTSMRTYERRMRGLRRTVPIAAAALVVSLGTFGVVRWTRTHQTVVPSNAPTVSAPPVASSASAKPSTAASVVASTKPSLTIPATALTHLIPPASTSATAPTGKTRWVKFNFSPAARYFTIDGGGHLDPFETPRVELTLGTHKLTAVGNGGCCELYTADIKVDPGEGDLDTHHKLKFMPVTIWASDIEDATITVTGEDGKTIASGKEPVRIEMTDTQRNVTITVEGGGKTYTKAKKLQPGNLVYLDEKQ